MRSTRPTATWDWRRYLTFADERARPFFDLLARVDADDPAYVVDLGCGPGNLTAALARRWPHAEVHGVDSSAEMVDRAAESQTLDRLRFERADLREWEPRQRVDVLVANAVLQWVPGHLALLPRLVGLLATEGWLALQVPGNFAEPSHLLLHELAGDPRFADHVAGVERPSACDPQRYLEVLSEAGCQVDAWETTYLHVLQGPDPVLRWISGTGARPVLQALPNPLRAEFEAEYAKRLASAYPAGERGTVLPFRRVFAVAHRIDELPTPS
jgi:trans-aconitate 2-methyltransferase